MANEPIRIIGLDPGLRRTGWGVIAAEGARLRWVAHGVVTPPEAAGRRSGPAVEIGRQPGVADRRETAAAMSETTMAMCWNRGLQPGTASG